MLPWDPHEWLSRAGLTGAKLLPLVRVEMPPGKAHAFHIAPFISGGGRGEMLLVLCLAAVLGSYLAERALFTPRATACDRPRFTQSSTRYATASERTFLAWRRSGLTQDAPITSPAR